MMMIEEGAYKPKKGDVVYVNDPDAVYGNKIVAKEGESNRGPYTVDAWPNDGHIVVGVVDERGRVGLLNPDKYWGYTHVSNVVAFERPAPGMGIDAQTHAKESPWRPRVGEWVWYEDKRDNQAEPAKIKDNTGGVYEVETARYHHFCDPQTFLNLCRPLRLSEVQTEEQAQQFIGRWARCVAEGSEQGKIFRILEWVENGFLPWNCISENGRDKRCGKAENLELLEEEPVVQKVWEGTVRSINAVPVQYAPCPHCGASEGEEHTEACPCWGEPGAEGKEVVRRALLRPVEDREAFLADLRSGWRPPQEARIRRIYEANRAKEVWIATDGRDAPAPDEEEEE